jgi:hypothetical protein
MKATGYSLASCGGLQRVGAKLKTKNCAIIGRANRTYSGGIVFEVTITSDATHPLVRGLAIDGGRACRASQRVRNDSPRRSQHIRTVVSEGANGWHKDLALLWGCMAVRVVENIISSVRLVVREALNGVAMEVDESVLNTLCIVPQGHRSSCTTI